MADPAEVLGFGRTPPHDYDLVLRRRWRAPWSRIAVGALTSLAAFTVGFVMTTGLSAGREVAIAQLERKDQLIDLIVERREHADELAEDLEVLRSRVEEAQGEAARGVPALRAEVERTELAAGMVAVQGPGLRVTLEDSPSCPPGAYECVIQDGDIQLAVNALFGAGAEAVAVGGERVVATTAIRGVGHTILVNLSVLTGPYVITAIGDEATLGEAFEQSPFFEQFTGYTQDYGLAIDVEEVDQLDVPRFSGTVGMTTRPASGQSAIDR
jgi:uncharacterized protein YlxW (UPF0749 family)